MRLGREVDDLRHLVLVPGLGHRGRVADVALDERELVGVLRQQIAEVGQVAGVGQLVERDELYLLPAAEEQADEVAADEAGRAGDENASHIVFGLS